MFFIRKGGTTIIHTCANLTSPSLIQPCFWSVCPGLCSYVSCTLRANVEVTCFPEDRLAARAINYKRQGARQTERQTDWKTDSQTDRQQDRQYRRERRQAGQEQAPTNTKRGGRARTAKKKIILPLYRVLQLSAPPLSFLLPVDYE